MKRFLYELKWGWQFYLLLTILIVCGATLLITTPAPVGYTP